MKTILGFFVLLGVGLLAGNLQAQTCHGTQSYAQDSEFIVRTARNEIKIMSYNLENLFDAEHDEGRDDYEFLPITHPGKAKCNFKQYYYREMCKKLDWTHEKVLMKLGQIRQVVAFQGGLPDIMAVQEVEGDKALGMLAETLGFDYYIHTSGNDKRIQLGLMFNERKIFYREAHEFVVAFPDELGVKTTRNILVVHFSPRENPKSILALYVNHWPSQAAPSAARGQAAQTLRNVVDYFSANYGAENYHVVAVGDFNTLDQEEEPHPFSYLADPSWKNSLLDLDAHYYREGHLQDPQQMHLKMPPGTYYYGKDRTWNKLDHFFVSQNLLDGSGMDVNAGSYRILAGSFMLTTHKDSKSSYCHYGIPNRYDFHTTQHGEAGFSDHFPILMKVKLH